MADDLPAFTVEEIPDLVSDPAVRAMPSANRTALLEHALGTAHADLTREGSLSPEDHAGFRQMAQQARDRLYPGMIEKGTDIIKSVPSALGGMVKDLGAFAGGVGTLLLPTSDETKADVGDAMFGSAANAITTRAAGISERMGVTGGFPADESGSYVAEPTSGQTLDSALSTVKRALDSGAHLNEQDGTFKGAAQSLKEALAAYHTDTGAPGRLDDPQNAMLLNAYAATGNPGSWDKLRQNLLKTQWRATTEQDREELAKSPGAKQFNAIFGEGASEHLINGMDPVLIAATGLPLLRGAGVVSKGVGALGKAASFAAQQTAFGVDAALKQNPLAGAGEITESVANMAALGGAMHGAGALVRRVVNGKVVEVPATEAPRAAQAPLPSVETGEAVVPPPSSVVPASAGQETPAPVNPADPAASPRAAETAATPPPRNPEPAAPAEAAGGPPIVPPGEPPNPPREPAAAPPLGTADTSQSPPDAGATAVSEVPASSPEYPRAPAGDQAPYSGPTSIRNAQVDAERAARGLPPLMEPARREWGTAWDEASQTLDTNQNAGVQLVDELNREPRSLSDTENALLLQHKLSVQDQIRRTVDVLNDPAADEGAKATARLDMARHNAALDAVDNAGKSAGTHMGRGLNARKMWAGDDDFYQLPTMLAREQAMKGEPLTPREVDDVQARAATIDKARAAMLAHDDAVAEREAHEGTVRIIDDLKQEAAGKPAEVAADVETETKSTLEQQRNEVLARMQARKSGFTNLDVSEKGKQSGYVNAQIIGETTDWIKAKGEDFAAWSAEMIARFGEAIREHLPEIWSAAKSSQQQPDVIAKWSGGDRVPNDFLEREGWQSLRDAVSAIDEGARRANDGIPRKATDAGTKDAEAAALWQTGWQAEPLSESTAKGGEHTVEFRSTRVFKETHPETFGARFDPERPEQLQWGTPLQYLNRWRLFNEYFGADVKFHGVVRHRDGTVALQISQKKILGDHPKQEVIDKTFRDDGWKEAGVNTWKKETSRGTLTASDAKESNFVIAEDGTITPIDVLMDMEPKRGGVVSSLEQQAQKARERQQSRRGKTFADPFGVMAAADLADSAIIGAYHIANGAVKFAEWSKKMIEDFGEKIRPHLQSIFKSAQQHHDDTRRTITEKVRSAKSPESAETVVNNAAAEGKVDAAAIVKLARAHLLQGAATLKDLLDKVHADAVKIKPDITRREVQDALSGYGKVSQPSKKQIEVQLREMKAQARLTSAYEDATKGKAPLRTGFQRGKPSDKVRELGRAVKDAMRKMGIVTTSKEQQLATALDAVKTRLRNQIADLSEQLKTGAKTPKRPGINYDAEANKLKAQRDALSEKLQELEGPRVITEEQRLKQAMSAAQRSLDEYNRRIREGDLSPRGRMHGPDPKALNELKLKRDQAKAHLDYLKDIANPKATKEEIALKQYKARVAAGIKNLERRAATGDFSKRQPAEIKLDEEAQRLKARYEAAKLEERRRVKAKELSERSTGRKIGDTLIKWQRGFILSGVKTLGKLATAAMYRIASTPLEEAVGGVLGRLPGLRRVAEGAPREGGFSLKAEAKALTQGFVKGLRQFGQVLRTGKGNLDLAHGKIHTYDLDKSVMDYFGQLHAAFKNPIKEAEFSRSFEKRMRHAIDSGLDGTDPAVQMKVAAAAYGDAKGAIFMQDNAVVNGINAAIGTWERGGTMPYVLAKLTRAIIPVMRIPTNYVAETGLYVGGLASGSAKFASALLRGLDTLKPEERDLIMKHFKKGTVGGAMVLLGFLNPGSVGGYYTEREKRKPGDVHHGTFRVFGAEIPQWASHAPIIEAMQFGATMRRVTEGMNHAHTAATGAPGLPGATAAAALGLLSEVPAFRAAETATDLLKGSDYAVGELVKSFTVPQLVSDAAKASDWGHDRKMKSWQDHLKANIPGLRQTLPLKPVH